jgi:hypothetical protein
LQPCAAQLALQLSIPVAQGSAAQLGSANALASMGGAPAGAAAARPAADPGNTHLAAAQQSNQAPPGCNTPQAANNPACKLNNNKITNATNNLNNGAAAVAAPVNAVKQLGDTLGGLFKKPAPAPAAPTPQTGQ